MRDANKTSPEHKTNLSEAHCSLGIVVAAAGRDTNIPRTSPQVTKKNATDFNKFKVGLKALGCANSCGLNVIRNCVRTNPVWLGRPENVHGQHRLNPTLVWSGTLHSQGATYASTKYNSFAHINLGHRQHSPQLGKMICLRLLEALKPCERKTSETNLSLSGAQYQLQLRQQLQ